jgi:integrase
VLEKAGLPAMRYHDLRHSAASLMLASGMDLRIISEVLGHSVPAMSALYAHVMPKLKTDLAAVVDAALTVEREAK